MRSTTRHRLGQCAACTQQALEARLCDDFNAWVASRREAHGAPATPPHDASLIARWLEWCATRRVHGQAPHAGPSEG